MLHAQKTYTPVPDMQKFHMHTHDNFEIYCFLAGNAKYFVEGTVYTLKAGDILVIRKAEAHSLLMDTDAPYERIVINFTADALLEENTGDSLAFLTNKPLGKNNRYPAANCKEMRWQQYLESICAAEDFHEKRLYLTVLVRELNRHFSKTQEQTVHDSTADIIAYINEHLDDMLSLDSICKEFFLNKSQLNRNFKRMTSSTVWEYIVTKRLLLAKELLQNGITPTAAAEKSGFHDYCTFFRAYKAKFGVSPKRHFQKAKDI